MTASAHVQLGTIREPGNASSGILLLTGGTSRTKGKDASLSKGHTRGHQPTAHPHQAANAILTVSPPPVGVGH